MAGYPDRLAPGSPYPLGATWDGLGTNFAVYSAHAERIDLCLFDPSGKREIATFTLPATCRTRRSDRSMVIVPTGPMSRSADIASIRTSSCSILTRGASPAN